ncbi:MAG: hypothetical protein Q8Q52_08645 [Acidimicrobiia bacterium]|nr:hypothetical protein [Acidimicrobiia bacterium]
MKESAIWIVAGAVVAALAGLIGFGAGGPMVLVIAPLMLVAVTGVGRMISTSYDGKWLPTVIAVGFIAKLAGAGARYYFIRFFYAGGDALRYYRVGIDLAHQWRAGSPPALSGDGSLGTQVLEAVTGFVFAPFTPDLLGGFFLFAALSFLGQVMMYTAFRRSARPHQLKPFALLIFLLPTFAFWPSSIGKDAVVLFGLGVATYAVARLLEAYQIRWLGPLAVALAGVAFIRIHISALLVGSLLAAAVIAKTPSDRSGASIGFRRVLVTGSLVAISLVSLATLEDRFSTDLTSAQDVDSFSEEIVRRTSSGTSVAGAPARGPEDIPKAVLLVIYRPFLWEARQPQIMFAALETAFFLGLTLWKLPAMVRNRRLWRRSPFVVFSTVYLIAFSVAFSVIRNLGIIARQRSQVIGSLLVIVIGLGWEQKTKRQRRKTSYLPVQPDADDRSIPLVV